MEKQKNIPVNALWRLRHAQGIELKQVGKLLGNNSADNIGHYEKGDSFPNLKTTIKLMLIYNSNPKEMFPDLFECCRKEIEANLKRYSSILSMANRENLGKNINSCTYEEMLNSPNLTDNDKIIIRKHITKLANTLPYR